MADPRRAPNRRIPRDNASVDLQVAVDAFALPPGLTPQTRRTYWLTVAALSRRLT